MTTGDRIRDARNNSGLTQTELASRLGISKQLMYKYENDIVKNIPMDTLKEIAQILDVSPAYLADFTDTVISNNTLATEISNERVEEFIHLFEQLSESEQNIVIAQIKGILSGK